jgi:hypothetical protein
MRRSPNCAGYDGVIGMKVAIHQPNYLPWCGYFAKISACDAFIFLDDAQMSKGSYVSRTKVRSNSGPQWLTVPTKVHVQPAIDDVATAYEAWAKKHLATLRQTYAKAPYASEVMAIMEPEYEAAGHKLGKFNRRIVLAILEYLDIRRPTFLSSAFDVHSIGDDRLIDLVRTLGGTQYISGRGGANYQDPDKFRNAGIELEVCEYRPVPYEAPGFPVLPGLSIVDALFIKGRAARDLLRYSGS